MSHPLPNMLEATMEKIKSMISVNSVIGDPIVTPEGVTIIPVSRVSYGFGGGGSDFVSKNASSTNPFGGGTGVGVKIVPVAFLVIQNGNVRMLPIAQPASTAADRVVELIPDFVDKISSFIDNKKQPKDMEE